jgi:DegV family protein with EDD domain
MGTVAPIHRAWGGIGHRRRGVMQIVIDSGILPHLPRQQIDALDIHVVPLHVTIGDRTFHEGADLDSYALYEMVESNGDLPSTSQPSPGEFATVYRQLAADDPDILSMHISSGLSGTLASAQAGARQVPEARITHVDTRSLSGAAGWQVEAAARARNAGWPLGRVLELVDRVAAATTASFTLSELRYLVHGGRVSHMKRLIASMLSLKPLITVEKERGTCEQSGLVRTFGRALRGLVDLIGQEHAPGSALRVQVLHGANPEGAEKLRALLDARYQCTWLPVGPISMVLGAHAGPSLVGVGYGPAATYAEIP